MGLSLRQLLVLAAWAPITIMAQTTTQPGAKQTGATQTTSSFPSMTAIDGLGVSEGGVGSQVDSKNPGADGHDSGSINLSTGGIVGIAIAIGVVVLGIGKPSPRI
jgi:hypothetical protein